MIALKHTEWSGVWLLPQPSPRSGNFWEIASLRDIFLIFEAFATENKWQNGFGNLCFFTDGDLAGKISGKIKSGKKLSLKK